MNPATIFVVVLFGATVGNVFAKDYEVTISIPRKIGQFSITGLALQSAILTNVGASLDDGTITWDTNSNVAVTTHMSNDHVIIDMIANQFTNKPVTFIPQGPRGQGSAEMHLEAEVKNKNQVAITDAQPQKMRFTANMPSFFLESSVIRVVTENYWHLHQVEEKGPSETEGPFVATLRLAPPQGSNLESDMHTIKDTSIVYRPGTTIGEVTLTVSDMTKFEITATAKRIEHLLENRSTTGDTIVLKGEARSITIDDLSAVIDSNKFRIDAQNIKYLRSNRTTNEGDSNTMGDHTVATDVHKLTIAAKNITHVEHSPDKRITTKRTIKVTEPVSEDLSGDESRGQEVEVKYKINLLPGRTSYKFLSWRADQIKKDLLANIITAVVVSPLQPSIMDTDTGLKIKVPDAVNAFAIESRWRQDPTRTNTNGEDDFIMDTKVSREGNGWTVTSKMDLSVDTSVEEKINCNSDEGGHVRRRRLDEDDVYDCLGESGRNSAGSGPSKVSIVLMSVLIPLGFIGIVIVACYYRQKPEATELELGPDIEFPTKMQGLGYARYLRIGGVADDQA